MEEDAGVRAAPVLRLRRRLSVEADETKSPSTPSTPTKKRGTRLAAKPQLELIDEHAVTESPKRTTRKSISRDILEPEEKPVTPARRSTRSKSNTSIVSEAEEKPLTPSRRSTRIKSNTSIVSEAVQSVDSPRAKRAIARRNSQVDSDTETPSTPARTRRTRKASTSSIDKEETVSETSVTPGRTRRARKGSTSSIDIPAEAVQADKPQLITEVIPEEPEGTRRSTNISENVDSSNDSPTRKSPRLLAKKGKKTESEITSEISTKTQDSSVPSDNIQMTTSEENKQHKKAVTESVTNNDISLPSASFMKDEKQEEHKKMRKKNNKNKSMSDIEDTLDSKKRNRTKSWTTITASSPVIEGNFYSDNESTKKKINKHGTIIFDKRPFNVGCGDGSNQSPAAQNDHKNQIFETSMKKKNKRNSSIANTSGNISTSEQSKEVDISSESNKENLLGVAPIVKDASELLFEKAPIGEIQTMVFIEDSDSNTGIESKQKKQDGEDQCVPVVMHGPVIEVVSPIKQTSNGNIFALNNVNEKDKNNDSVEPMDIDETMPENISLTIFSDEGKQRKTSLSISENADCTKNANNKSQRKSSVSYSVTQTIDNFENKQSPKSFKEIPDKPKEKSLLSESISKDDSNEEITVENHNASINASKSVKKSRKSSIAITSDSDNSEVKNKTNRKSTLINSFSQNNEVEGEMSTEKHLKSSMSVAQDTDSKENKSSKRKGSMSNSINSDTDKTENKSTLVLSHIKDSTAENSVLKSPRKKESSLSITMAEPEKDAPVNKNIIANYMTSTPVQQKNLEKLAIQMNTSVITPTNQSKKDPKLGKSTPKHNESVSKSSEEESSDEGSNISGENEESSQDKSNLFDDKAEDAGYDYESGDSQDEDERQYAKDHEIVDEGETLTSDEDISNDSDYEKDSFIVSSDDEDKELLSGSGDDLDISDNELTLSSKSKKKYNERKIKEQKNASKEMYEARHGLNKSNKHSDSNKINRSRLDSTLLKSDEELMPPKKNKRMRLESTLESIEDAKYLSVSGEDKIGYIKKKSKRLSESICNESNINEKEITIQHENTTQKKDPLSVQIKLEPRTPQKDLEISRVHITDDVEQVQVDENASIMKADETSDPLQATIRNEGNGTSDDEQSISENEEIANNYDSVLKALNEDRNKLIKSHDISLNLNKKKGKKAEDAIVYELNLTKTKTKNSKKDISVTAKEKSIKRVFKQLADNDDASSDAIDLKLLFSDESNGSDKRDESKKTKFEETEDLFIPLKKSEAKTDILKSIENCVHNDEEEGPFNFFIDTKGDFSGKEKVINEESDSNGPPVELLYVSEKKMNRSSVDDKNNSPLNKTPGSATKKKRISETMALDIQEPEVSMSKTPISEKNKKSAGTNEEKLFIESATKTKKLSKSQEQKEKSVEQEQNTFENDVIACSSKKRKRQTSTNKSFDDIVAEDTKENTSQQLKESTPGSKKKKLKTSNSLDTPIQDDLTAGETPQQFDKEKRSKKTKKRKHMDDVPSAAAVQELEPQRVSKKRKRDDDEGGKISKVLKENSFDKVHVQRLPSSIVEQLEDRPNLSEKNIKVVSTSNFIVEETKKRKNKPSYFLEETVYVNSEPFETTTKKKASLFAPRVLPFYPSQSISDSGFTTNFHVNVISSKMEFVAQKNDVPNFRNEYLNNKKIKKLRTYDLLKRHRISKLSKF